MNYLLADINFRKYRWLLLGAGALLFAVSIPYNSLFFLNDDFTSVPVYSRYQFTYGFNTRVVPAISIYFDYVLYKSRAAGYIFTNVLLHLACCGAGYAWCRQLYRSFHLIVPQWVFLCSAILFMWFGFHSEVILWLICRTASISLLFFFGAWACFFRSHKNRIWLLPGFGCALAGLLSYEILLLLPVQIAAWYFFNNHKASRRLPLQAILVSGIAILCFYGIKYIITHQLSDNYGTEHFTGLHLSVLAKNYCSLLIRTFAPPLANKWLVAGIGLALLLLLGVIAYHIIVARKADAAWKFLLFNWLCSYVLFCSLGIDLSGNESDRYLYIPSFFFCSWFVHSLFLLRLGRIQGLLVAGLVLLYNAGNFLVSIHRFQQAGTIAKETLSIMYQHQSASGTIVQNLPAKAYGIPILRSGVKNGLKWLYPQMDTAKIVVESQIVLQSGQQLNSEAPFFQYFHTAKDVSVIHFFPQLSNEHRP